MKLIKMIGRIHWLLDESLGVWYKRIDFDGRLVEVSFEDVPSVVRGLVVVAPSRVISTPVIVESVKPVSEVVVPVKEVVSTEDVVGIRAMQKRRKKEGMNKPVGRPRLREYDMDKIVGEVLGGSSVSEVCGRYGISRSVYYAYVKVKD